MWGVGLRVGSLGVEVLGLWVRVGIPCSRCGVGVQFLVLRVEG